MSSWRTLRLPSFSGEGSGVGLCGGGEGLLSFPCLAISRRDGRKCVQPSRQQRPLFGREPRLRVHPGVAAQGHIALADFLCCRAERPFQILRVQDAERGEVEMLHRPVLVAFEPPRHGCHIAVPRVARLVRVAIIARPFDERQHFGRRAGRGLKVNFWVHRGVSFVNPHELNKDEKDGKAEEDSFARHLKKQFFG